MVNSNVDFISILPFVTAEIVVGPVGAVITLVIHAYKAIIDVLVTMPLAGAAALLVFILQCHFSSPPTETPDAYSPHQQQR